jgi:uncharacterized membrane protein YciS (DUF1049 family)
MLRKIWLILGIILLLVIMLVGIEFAAINSQLVTVNYFLGAASWPLSLVVVCAFSVGVVVAIVIGFAIFLPLRFRVGRLKRAVSDQENEISVLRKRMARDVR